MKNNIKVGFPLKLIDDNLKIIKDKEIYYLIIESRRIIDRYNNGNNNYQKYTGSVFDVVSFNNRINIITKRIKSVKDKSKKEKLLFKI